MPAPLEEPNIRNKSSHGRKPLLEYFDILPDRWGLLGFSSETARPDRGMTLSVDSEKQSTDGWVILM